METAADGQQLQNGGAPAAAWAPHGRLLTACLVALNVLLVLLVYLYFWRFFSRRGADADQDAADAPSDDEDEEAAEASPKALRDQREAERAIAALPVFVHSTTSSGGGGGVEAAVALECAICIAEFADGEEGRLLPRCGHRFHARCVDAWFRSRTTCPLCRATVLLDVAPPDQQAAANRSPPSDTDAECPPV